MNPVATYSFFDPNIRRALAAMQRDIMPIEQVMKRNQRSLMAVQRVVEQNQRAIDGALAAYRVALPVLPLLELPLQHRSQTSRPGDLPDWVADAPEPVFRAWLEGRL